MLQHQSWSAAWSILRTSWSAVYFKKYPHILFFIVVSTWANLLHSAPKQFWLQFPTCDFVLLTVTFRKPCDMPEVPIRVGGVYTGVLQRFKDVCHFLYYWWALRVFYGIRVAFLSIPLDYSNTIVTLVVFWITSCFIHYFDFLKLVFLLQLPTYNKGYFEIHVGTSSVIADERKHPSESWHNAGEDLD